MTRKIIGLVILAMMAVSALAEHRIPEGVPGLDDNVLNRQRFEQANPEDPDYLKWIATFGHDGFRYPDWVEEQMQLCSCSIVGYNAVSHRSIIKCVETGKPTLRQGDDITFCSAKQWLLDRMPEFDKAYLPPSVSLKYGSMLDDNIAFSLMAFAVAPWSSRIPTSAKLGYILPYATFHEARTNWRPLFFARYFALVSNAKTTVEAIRILSEPGWTRATVNRYVNMTTLTYPSYNVEHLKYWMQWSSGSTPPIVAPADFMSYGYGSCTAHSTMMAYVARAVGIPARVAAAPCWNTGIFRGTAKTNPNVTQCWKGTNGQILGKQYLNNHSWLEFWDDVKGQWVFLNSPPMNLRPNTDLCEYDEKYGCDYNPVSGRCDVTSGPGMAGTDHDIFTPTWLLPNDQEPGMGQEEKAPIVDAKDLKLSNGEKYSPMVWSPNMRSPIGVELKDIGLRVLNRTDFYRCKGKI